MLTEYITYLEDLTNDNVQITAAGGAQFRIIGIEEAESGVVSEIPQNGYFVHGILPSMRYTWNQDHHVSKLEAGIKIGKMFVSGDSQTQIEALKDVWELTIDIIEKMLYDSQNEDVFFANGFNKADELFMEPHLITGDTCYVSVTAMWSPSAYKDFCKPNPDKWT